MWKFLDFGAWVGFTDVPKVISVPSAIGSHRGGGYFSLTAKFTHQPDWAVIEVLVSRLTYLSISSHLALTECVKWLTES